jgi:RsiW-degrading membrane proteinase PrsW (M82 family)
MLRGLIYIALNIIGLILLVRLLTNAYKRYKNTKDESVKKFLIVRFGIISLLVAVPVLIVHEFAPELELKSFEAKEAFYKSFSLNLALHDLYFDELQKRPHNHDLNVKALQAYSTYTNSIDKNDPPTFENAREKRWIRLEKHYQTIIDSAIDYKQQQQSLIFLGLHYSYSNNPARAKMALDKVKLVALPYYDLALGKTLAISQKRSSMQLAKEHLSQSIADSIEPKMAYNALARMYYYYRHETQLDSLVNNAEAYNHLRPFYKRIVFYRANSWFSYFAHVITIDLQDVNIWGFIGALLILLAWLYYVYHLDVFEPEKWYHILATLCMGMGFVYLIYPMSDFIREQLEIFPSSDPILDFFYMFLKIGVPEELVKILPVLIMLKFTKAINEPYDYILYASVSALGFAFVENLGYIQYDTLYNINARSLMSSIAHMTFSSTIAYGMVLQRYNQIGRRSVMFAIFFVLAALMHTFYDFWLIHEGMYNYHWITTISFLVGVYLWHIFINNTLNISTFYSPHVKLNTEKTKFYLIIALLTIFMYDYGINSFTRGLEYGYDHIVQASFSYGFLILYFGLSLSNFNIAYRYLAPIKVPPNFLIPKVKALNDYSGLQISLVGSKTLRLRKKYEHLAAQYPIKGTLVERFVLEGNTESYLLKLHQEQYLINVLNNYLVLMPKSNRKTLNSPKSVLVYVFLVPDEATLNKNVIKNHDLVFAGWAVSRANLS